jgi:predicted enzyme related to lactoylglutathione lyase
MTMAGYNAITWFEIGTDNPGQAKRFYGEVFGWTVSGEDSQYQIITPGAGEGLPAGGLFDTQGAMPGYAIFTVLVQDVAGTCAQVEKAGGKVQRAPQVTPDGLTFAYLTDPAGNQFGVFTPPAGQQ